MDIVQAIEAHAAYMSPQDEEAIVEAAVRGADPADWALRTCRCGAVIDGFDGYHLHLLSVVRALTQASHGGRDSE